MDAMDESDLERQPLCEGPHPITPRKIHCSRRHELIVVLLIALVFSAVWEMANQQELHARNAVESSGKMQVKYETSLGGWKHRCCLCCVGPFICFWDTVSVIPCVSRGYNQEACGVGRILMYTQSLVKLRVAFETLVFSVHRSLEFVQCIQWFLCRSLTQWLMTLRKESACEILFFDIHFNSA